MFARFIVAFLLMGCSVSALAEERVSFARDVLPILRDKCFACHGSESVEGGLRLDVRRRAMLGGDSGSTIVSGSAKDSELIARVTTDDKDRRMPADELPMSPKEITTLRDWIDQGVDWPDELAGREQPSDHRAFRKITRPDVPTDTGDEHPIDAFISARLRKHGLQRLPEAGRTTLIRRLYLDLLGLPPTPADVETFVDDQDEQAYQKLVDRLLESEHFGERWGRHWLDLARFAESDGYENDRIRPHAFRFRDWVVDAFNRDLPFDQFTIEQLAGDLLPDATESQQIATGFHRNTLWNSAASADREEFRIRAVKDRAETTGTVWMGLTLRCCQCHSHKYDPISQREYYRMYAFFNRTENHDLKITGGEAQALRAVKRDSFVHRRGNFLSRGPLVEPATPVFLPPLAKRGDDADRLDLARWLVSPDHPLTARVAVNRFWQHLFGTGLVATPENFGTNGEAPSHPRLLDWLASEFMRLGWSRKQMIRTIVLSATYRQRSHLSPSSSTPSSSTSAERAATIDPDNRLLWRQNRLRVESEIVRDLALSVSGLLNDKIGGPSVVPPFPEGLGDFRLTNESLRGTGGDRYRRGVYIHVQRTFTFPTLAEFDAADGNEPCVRRDRSTTPMQALALLNDPVFAECARALGKRIESMGAESMGTESMSDRTNQRLRQSFVICFARPPSDAELKVLSELVVSQQEAGAPEEQVWCGVARTLLNLEAFIMRE